MGNSNVAVICDGLTKVFGEGDEAIHALRGVELEVRFGESTFLVGPSGSGKTTLLCVIAALLNPTSGRLEVLGENMHELVGRRRILFRRKNLGFVFQSFNLIPSLTAAENAAVPLMIDGVSRKTAVARANDLLDSLGLESRKSAFPSHLSSGQQQRVAIARALIHDPRLILCDEPTAALDGDMGHSVMRLLTSVAVRPDRAVVVVTHDSRTFEFAETMAFMTDGVIVRSQSGKRQKLLSRPASEYPTTVEPQGMP